MHFLNVEGFFPNGYDTSNISYTLTRIYAEFIDCTDSVSSKCHL